MTLEEAIELHPDALYAIITLAICEHCKHREKSDQFDQAIGFDWNAFTNWWARKQSDNWNPLAPWAHSFGTDPYDVCHRAFKLGYIEQAMRAQAGLESVGVPRDPHVV